MRWPNQGHTFSVPLFGQLAAQWSDWRQGIPPGGEWRGRGAQNPRLLLAFNYLDRARNRAENDAHEAAAQAARVAQAANRTRR